MLLSHYVHELTDCYFNLVTLKTLPKNSSTEELSQNYFLQGQEQEAVQHRLFDFPSKVLGIKVIPTWECNLRCKHCFVLPKLVKEDHKRLDVERLIGFVDRVLDYKSIDRIGIGFIGGEATLRAADCIEVIDKLEKHVSGRTVFMSSMTTNGTNWNRDVAELISRLMLVTFSLDGVRASHNDQRHAYAPELKGVDLYQTTLRNIKKCVLLGFADKIRVQASLYNDSYSAEFIEDYFKQLLKAGIKREHIVIGSAVPTKTNYTVSALYEEYLTTVLYPNPCCKYRVGNEFVVDTQGKVYCDYFDDYTNSCLGDLDTPYTEILQNHKNMIQNTMPVLNDEKCKSCPVLGVCWGRCCNTDFMEPSKHCKPEALLAVVKGHIQDNTLLQKLRQDKKKECS